MPRIIAQLRNFPRNRFQSLVQSVGTMRNATVVLPAQNESQLSLGSLALCIGAVDENRLDVDDRSAIDGLDRSDPQPGS